MGDWPTPFLATPSEAISPWSESASVGDMLLPIAGVSAGVSTAWPAANRAIFIPFRISRMYTITQAVVGCGSVAGGNFDVGVYDTAGNKLTSSGATARTANVEVVANFTDVTLGPGVYYMAMAADGTNNYTALSPAQAGLVKAMGIKEAGTSYTLPSTVTYATVSSAFIPSFAIYSTAT